MKAFRIPLALACCAVALTGCFGSVESDVCNRADECNALNAGVSVKECTERTTQCTDKLTSTDRADWETLTNNCLELQSCTNFVGCYNSVPNC
jgi:hypothetical protein